MFLRTQEVCAAKMAENVDLEDHIVASSCHTREINDHSHRQLLLGAVNLGGKSVKILLVLTC